MRQPSLLAPPSKSPLACIEVLASVKPPVLSREAPPSASHPPSLPPPSVFQLLSAAAV